MNTKEPRPKDQNTLVPREMRTQLTPKLSPSSELIDLLKYKTDEGILFIPKETWSDPNKFSRKAKREIILCNREVKKRKREQLSTLPSLPSGQIRPRSLDIRPSRRNEVNASIKDSLDQLRNLDAMGTMAHDL